LSLIAQAGTDAAHKGLSLQIPAPGAAATPEVREKIVRDGADPVGKSPAEFAKYFGNERKKWRKVVRQIGLLRE